MFGSNWLPQQDCCGVLLSLNHRFRCGEGAVNSVMRSSGFGMQAYKATPRRCWVSVAKLKNLAENCQKCRARNCVVGKAGALQAGSAAMR